MYDLYEESRNLNMKKVVGVILIFIILIIILIFIFTRKNKQENTTLDKTSTTSVFYDKDNSISLELPNTFSLKQTNDSEYLIDLHSENNLNIFIAREDNISNKQFSNIVEIDKNVFLENFNSYSNLSEIKELSVNGNPAYTYSFHYLDESLNKAFYLQVTWLKMGDFLYTFDIEFPLDDISFNTNISSLVLSNFKVE